MNHLRPPDTTADLAALRERTDAAEDYRCRLEGLRVAGCHDQATVVLGHTGALVDLHLGDGLDEAPARTLRDTVLLANRAARARLLDEVTELTAATFGVASATTCQLVQQYERVLGVADGSAAETAPGTAPAGVLR